MKKALGFRVLMDLIPLKAELVRGSHGRADAPEEHGPLVLSTEPELLPEGEIDAVAVKALILSHLFDDQPHAGSPPHKGARE